MLYKKIFADVFLSLHNILQCSGCVYFYYTHIEYNFRIFYSFLISLSFPLSLFFAKQHFLAKLLEINVLMLIILCRVCLLRLFILDHCWSFRIMKITWLKYWKLRSCGPRQFFLWVWIFTILLSFLYTPRKNNFEIF